MLPRKSTFWLILSAVLLALSGCCCPCRCPRIDPTGESFFIWPDEQATVNNPFAPAAVGPSATNPVAPPVFSDPGLPGTFAPPVANPPVAAVPGATPAVSPTNVVGTTVAASAPGPQDMLTLTPNRVLAPVGSEVILRAGVCSSSGYYIVNQRVEWMIDRAGPGQIVTVGERGQLDMFRCPQNTPRKVDNWYAIGATIPYHVCLDRGTADLADDLQIRPGEAWVSVSSATEGTSYVTAYSPAVGNWPGRTARATIIWVDALWEFPPSVTIPAGQSHTLTTLVRRQSDGAPLAGYIVRYEVVGGGRATVGYDAGQASEVVTDNQGRARVEITPTDNAPGSTTVNIQIIRAEQPGAAGARVTLGSGATSITWAGSGASPIPQLPAGQVPPPTSQPPQPLPFVPPATEQPVPPLGATIPGKPQLEVSVVRETADPISVGQNVRFKVTVTNKGTAPAKNIVVRSDFDRGLSHPGDTQGDFSVKSTSMRELGPGESDSLALTFTITKPGRQCQRVTVTADGTTAPVVQGCVDVVVPPAAEQPTLRVEWITDERAKSVGEETVFKSVVENTGTVAATNIVVELFYDADSIKPLYLTENHELPAGNPFRWRIARIAPGERLNFDMRVQFIAAAPNSSVRLLVRGDNVNYGDEETIEIRPAIGGPGGGSGNLRLSLVETANNAKVGETKPFYVNLDNVGVTSERDVDVAVLVPPNFTVDTTTILPKGSFQTENISGSLQIRFTPIAELRGGEYQRYTIFLTPNQAGAGTVQAQVKSRETPTPITQNREISILPR